MSFDLGSLLQQYIGGPVAAGQHAENHFDQAAQAAPTDILSAGLAAMFRSDQTPAFGQMAGQMFGQANPNQQAGMLNSLIASMGPAVLASLLNKDASGAGALGGLGGLLGELSGGGAAVPTLTPAQASQLSPEQVEVLVDHAQQADPGIIDRLSNFYAEHPTLVKTVGSAALTIALAKMAERARG
jgi:hypothetical protein